MKSSFEIFGYYKEYYFNGVYFGSIPLEKPDRDIIGYVGRRSEILTEDLRFSKGRIKKGLEVQTIMYPLCGRAK
jgi:hypothetical protein